jgi:hypothetical protein
MLNRVCMLKCCLSRQNPSLRFGWLDKTLPQPPPTMLYIH